MEAVGEEWENIDKEEKCEEMWMGGTYAVQACEGTGASGSAMAHLHGGYFNLQ